jgi:hypothetical protein
MPWHKNLLRDTWADLDQADLRLLLQERIFGFGQHARDVLHLPLVGEKCRISLTYKGAKIVAIEPGAAFDRTEWDRICAEIEGPILKGPQRVGREFSFSTFRVDGSGVVCGRDCKSFQHRRTPPAPQAKAGPIRSSLNFRSKKPAYSLSPIIAEHASTGG